MKLGTVLAVLLAAAATAGCGDDGGGMGDCPASRPDEGSACASGGLECEYSGPEAPDAEALGFEYRCTCESGSWSCEEVDCYMSCE